MCVYVCVCLYVILPFFYAKKFKDVCTCKYIIIYVFIINIFHQMDLVSRESLINYCVVMRKFNGSVFSLFFKCKPSFMYY